MTTTGVLLLLLLVALAAATLAVAARGGRGPGDPPASHRRDDPAGFPVLPAPRGVLHGTRRPAGAGARRHGGQPHPPRAPWADHPPDRLVA